MIPIAWAFSCRSRECSVLRRTRREATLTVNGDKATAIRQARELGWRPCSDLLGGRSSTAHWWCPECAGSYQARQAANKRTEATLQARLDALTHLAARPIDVDPRPQHQALVSG